MNTRENIYRVNTVNGTDIFFDSYKNRYYYWDNGKQRTSVCISKLVDRLNKQSKN